MHIIRHYSKPGYFIGEFLHCFE